MKKSDLSKILSVSQINQLELYATQLRYFNKTISLYSRNKPADFCWELILDSILAGQLLLKDCVHTDIADIGSGAGFPGVILAILDSSKKVCLFEPNKKKALFLEYIKWKLNVKNLKIKNIPVQDEKILLNCAVSKAFLPLNERLLFTQGCFNKGASYYHLQSLNWEEQWNTLALNRENKWELKLSQKYTYLTEKVLLKFIKTQ